MTTPEMNVLTRYQEFRTRRFLENDAKTRHWLPNWRTQAKRRKLVVAVGIVLAALVIISISSLFFVLAPLAWVPASIAFIALWTVLQTVSGRRGDAPAGALDEWEIQQRNEARSIGLTVTQTLVLAAAFASIFLSTLTDIPELAYAGGLWTLSALMIGICTPSMILAWITPDPEPDDI